MIGWLKKALLPRNPVIIPEFQLDEDSLIDALIIEIEEGEPEKRVPYD
jgi:hypothetical protein